MNKLIIITILISLNCTFINSQNKKEVNKIISSYDLIKLNQLSVKYNSEYLKNQKEVSDYIKKNNISLTKNENGNFKQIQRIENNKPIYYSTYNIDASKSTRADFLYNNGGLGQNIEGQGMFAIVWDGGHSLINHQEFITSGNSKLTIADSSTISDPAGQNHATHVIGTIMANGFNTNAKGMAPQATGYVLDWNNDVAEVISATQIGMLLSNHSYGPGLDNLAIWSIGAYTNESRAWDEVSFNAPYYLKVCAAGNDGNDSFTNFDPLDGNPQYDKLYGKTTAKNPLVVANANDANINSAGNIFSGGNINTSSSQGPTDDYRIKPDITGNGTNLFSPIFASTSSYDTYTGTSMASPNVTGSLLLLQQLYNQENGNFMLAATLKGLALHQADDRGTNGPDAKYGWGYLNTKKCAESILNPNEIITENILQNNEVYTFNVTATGSEPLKASISWTDAPSTNINTGTANDHTPVLVNDLDIRITQGTNTYLPWKMTSATTTTKGDNNVDPFENVTIDSPNTQSYTITINHKGNLVNSLQNYSLIVTGINSSTVSLDENIISDFSVYPNPSLSNKIINIATNNLSINSELKLYNSLGQVLRIEKLNSTQNFHVLDFSDVDSGIYFISINNEQIKKIILK